MTGNTGFTGVQGKGAQQPHFAAIQDQAGVLHDAYISAQHDIVDAHSQLTTVSIVLIVWGVVMTTGLIVLISVGFTRLRRNRFLADAIDRPSSSRKSGVPSAVGSRSAADAESGRQVDDDDDDDDDEDDYSEDDFDVVDDGGGKSTSDMRTPPPYSGQPFQTSADGHLTDSSQPSAVLESDLDPEDLPVDKFGARLAGMCVRPPQENYSEDELNARDVLHFVAYPSATSGGGVK